MEYSKALFVGWPWGETLLQRADAFRNRLLLNLPPTHPLRKDAEEPGRL
jgi:hypothetical protein